MKPFEFSLHSVLSIERQVDQNIDLQLTKAKSQLDLEITKLNQLQTQVSQNQVDVNDSGSLASVAGWATYRRHMERNMEQQQQVIENRRTVFNQGLMQKIRQQQKLESLEKLKATEKQDYRNEQRRMEQKQLLENVVQRKKRKV